MAMAVADLREHILRQRALESEDDYSGAPMSEAERAAEAERRRNKALEEARGFPPGPWRRNLEGKARILDFDPKQRGKYYNRLNLFNLSKLDLDEESSLAPMRFTHKVYQGEINYNLCLCEGVNILSVKIASSDVGFPIHVYGKVIARDSLDRKCLYLFNRDKNQPQLINSENKSLILSGPKRAIALKGDDYVEIDLKIKDHQGQDRELSKGFITIRGIAGRSLDKCTVESESLATRLSTMDVMYAVQIHAVEATVAIEIIRGNFYGEITAYTTSIRNSLVLYDSKLVDAMPGNGNGVIQLMRPVLSVCFKDMLMLSIVSWTADSEYQRTEEFTPRLNGGEEDEITLGSTKMRIKVTWSVMD